jgi:hypothetical protein
MNRNAVLALVASALAAAPLAAQADAVSAIRELQGFVNVNGRSTAVYGSVRTEVRNTIGGIRGCSVQITRDTQMPLLGNTAAYRVDLARLSPEISITPASGAPHLRVLELVAASGEEEIPLTLAMRTTRNNSQQWRINLTFDAAQAEGAGMLFTRAIQACGGQPASSEGVARLSSKRLFANGNDAETFPLKGRCLQMVQPLVTAATTLPADSSLTVLRLTSTNRIDVAGYVPDGESRRRFSCTFRREGQEWLPDGANLARSAAASSAPQ